FRVSRQAAQPAAEPQPRMESRAEARPEPRSDPKPARAAASDAAGKARMAGFTALQANDLEGAERQFQFALSRNRNDADAQGGMGLVALKKGDFAAARLALEAASRLGDATKWTEALGAARYFAGLETAQALVAKGQLDQARQAAEGLMRSGYKDTATAAELLADIYERQGRFADAADLYRQAGEGGSVNESRLQSRASRGRAMAAIERGDDIAAEQEFQQGLMLDQSDPWIRFEFARFMLRRGRLPETESLLASLSASADPDAIYAAAMLDSEMNRAQAAERLMARIPDSYRTAPMRNFAIGLKIDSAISRARTIAAGGQRGDAVATLKQLAATRGLAAGKLAAIADALYDMGDSVGAGALAMQALQGTITDMGSYEAIVRVAARTGRDDLARTAMQRATQLAGNSPDGQKALARMTAGTAVIQADRMRLAGQYASAFDVLQGAWGAAPDNTDVLGALARLYQSGRMWPRAAQTFQLILARDARNRDALSGLMEAAQAAGDKSLSQDAETRLLRTYPDNYESWLAAARTEQLRGNTGQATKYFKQARDMYTQAQSRPAPSGGGFGGNPFANQPMTASANPFRNVAPAAQAPAPAPVNPFALGSGTRLPTPAAVQPMSAPAGMGGAGFGDQGALPAALQPAAWQGDAASANAAYQPAVWQAPAVPAAGGYQTAAYQAPAAQAASGYQTAAYQPQAQQPAVAYQAAYQGQDGQQASAYPSGSYQTTPYQPGSYQNTPYQGGTYQGNAAPQMAAAFPPMSGSSDAGLPVATSSDPVLAGIERDIASMQQNNGPRGEVGTSYRQRAGETGLSAMGEMKASAQLSTGVGRGRIYAKAEMVTIDAGRPTGSSL
ncbi:MAG TPA: tetratricopeptide repeat protein, partial [Novosphingobium sp.]|nr:tetratricopeptide repeat protein [Novosphingobium sp.]